MNKVFSVVMVFVMALASTFFSPALTFATTNSDTQLQTQTAGCACNAGKKKVEKEEAVQNLTKVGVTVIESLTQQEISKIDHVMKKSDMLRNSLKDVEKKGFKSVKESESYVTMENVALGNQTFESVTFVAGYLESKKDAATKFVYEAIVDNTRQEVVKYQVLEVKDRQSKVISSYQQEMNNVPSIDWGGVHCDWVSVILCAHHCYIWSMVNPAAGAICEVVCVASTIFICNW